MATAQKVSKKRPAPTQAGPTPKKAHLTKSASKQQVKTTADKKRSRPVTLPIQEDNGSASESEEAFDDLEGGEDNLELDEVLERDEMDMGESNAPPKDPNAARESHKAQRALQATRRAQKPNSTLLSNAKSIWSLARQKNIPASERQKHIKALMDVMRGKVKDIVLKT